MNNNSSSSHEMQAFRLSIYAKTSTSGNIKILNLRTFFKFVD